MTHARRGWTFALVAIALALAATTAAAQRRDRGFDPSRYLADESGYYVPPDWRGNVPYDGRVTFARIKYRGFFRSGQEGPGWAHDYPRAESHLMRIMRELTSVRPFVQSGDRVGGIILSLDDPQLFRYPIAYLSEPGGWEMNAVEVAALRKYLLRGGFLIFDDFQGNDIYQLAAQMKRALPDLRPIDIPRTHALFEAFFKIDFAALDQQYGGVRYYGYFEDNDPTKRMLAFVPYNADIGEMWQFSDQGFFPVASSNEAYKMGVNLFIYALTH
jgi:hypothetical protein